jgi:predicted GNAT family acetyltransferase
MTMSTAVTDNEQERRYEIRVDGRLAGSTQYRRHPTVIELVHTVIEPEYEGRGLASELIRSALDAARDDGLQVLPYCPFVRGYIERHHEYLELVPAGRRAGFKLPV